MYSRVTSRSVGGGVGTEFVVKLEQVPRWNEQEPRSAEASSPSSTSSSPPDRSFVDPLTSIAASENGGFGVGRGSKFSWDDEINSKLYLWRGQPWLLEVDAVVNSTNEVRWLVQDYWESRLDKFLNRRQNLDEAQSSPGLHQAAGPGLAEECSTLVSQQHLGLKTNVMDILSNFHF